MTDLTRELLRLDRDVAQKLETAETAAEKIRRDADEEAEARLEAQRAHFDNEHAAKFDALEKALRQLREAADQSLRERKTSHRKALDPLKTVQRLAALAKEKECR